jgi:hypothetical protein
MDGNQAAAYAAYAMTEWLPIFPITPSTAMRRVWMNGPEEEGKTSSTDGEGCGNAVVSRTAAAMRARFSRCASLHLYSFPGTASMIQAYIRVGRTASGSESMLRPEPLRPTPFPSRRPRGRQWHADRPRKSAGFVHVQEVMDMGITPIWLRSGQECPYILSLTASGPPMNIKDRDGFLRDINKMVDFEAIEASGTAH